MRVRVRVCLGHLGDAQVVPQQLLGVARLLRRDRLGAQLRAQARREVLRGDRGVEQPLQLCSLQLGRLQLGRPPRVAVRLHVRLHR